MDRIDSEINDAFDFQVFHALMGEQQRWAQLRINLQEASKEAAVLCRDLARFDPASAVPMISGLLTIPEYQSNCIRLELLVALALIHCNGRKTPSITDLQRWFAELGKTRCVLGEDPAEDVFVSLVQTDLGDYRLLEGVWESAGFYTQRVINVVATMPDRGSFSRLKRAVRSLLVISDLVCSAGRLSRYQLGSDVRHASLLPKGIGSRTSLMSRVTIPFTQLTEHGVALDDLEPFFLSPKMRSSLLSQEVGLSVLDRMPLLVQRDMLVVALPTALSTALRSFVIEFLQDSGHVDVFDEVIADEFALLLGNTPLFGGPLRAPVSWRSIGTHRWATFVHEVDLGHILAFHLFFPSVRGHDAGGLKHDGALDVELVEALHQSMRGAEQHFGAKENFRRGLHVVVGCGWGKGYSAAIVPPENGKWAFESISAADLVRLSAISDMTPAHFWRLEEGLSAIKRAGVELVNLNGVLNLLGWMRRNHGHLVPHDELPPGRISPERPVLLNPPLNLLRDVRAEADLAYDHHSVRDTLGTWHDVCHINPNPLFQSTVERRLYSCLDCAGKGLLIALYEGRLHLWVELDTPEMGVRDIPYRLWDMVCAWLPRIGAALDVRLSEQLAQVLKVKVVFEDDQTSLETQVVDDLLTLCSTRSAEEPQARMVVFAKGFMSGFRIPTNVAERAVVRTLTRAYLELVGEPQADSVARELESAIVENDEARSFHVHHAHRFLDYVQDQLPEELIEIDLLDIATVRLGLGWRVERNDDSDTIKGKHACNVYLNGLVTVLVGDIVAGLGRFNRGETLHRLLLNCEKAGSKERHWKRTSAAVIGLHGTAPDAIQTVVKEMSRFAGANISSRVLAEIALCACPLEGGILPADLELSTLLARVSLLMRLGGLSDAIHYNALTPQLVISPLGDILFKDDFGNNVVEPMLAQAIGDNYVESAPQQRKHYLSPEIIPFTRGRLSEEFWSAWTVEMGFDCDEARTIIGALEDMAIRENVPVLKIRRSAYYSLAEEHVGEGQVRRFLEQFSLVSRPRWDKPPKKFAGKDIYPWRFGRRLSLVSRPILQVDTSDDPLLLIAPDLLRRGFAYVVDGAFRGELDQSFFQSNEMRNIWWGKASEGHTFNRKVTQTLIEAGWVAREGVVLPELLQRKLERDFGDIDVLAWRPNDGVVLVIECKDLSFARNYSEVAALLSEYQGSVVDGIPDKLRRHLDRFEFLEANLESVRRFTNLPSPRLVSCLVVSGIVPMQYARIDALTHTFVGSVEALLEVH
ncbi:hypothetical protein [Pseudomonas viridiflava]|nr:hypothetical protein [Pseudomonas viridiflava]